MKNKLLKITIIVTCVALIIGVGYISLSNKYYDDVPEEIRNSARTYDCDYHTLSLNTHISFEKDDAEYDITGNILTFLTDPLVISKNGKIIGKADDSYHIVGQDDHAVIINDKFEVDIHGNFELFGNSYDLYDQNKNKVGYAEFNTFCTKGAVFNSKNEAVAVYSKTIGFNDYSVTIYDNNICSDEAMMMVIGSYVSDYHADDKTSKKGK